MTPSAPSPYIWGARADIAVFGGSAAVALALAALSPHLSDAGAVPTWGWLVFVLAVDVAHVHATLFRTYFDRDELAKRRSLYIALPLLCWAFGVVLHGISELLFWRVLAYVAVTHFIRQQAGWVAIYRARSGDRSRLGRLLDDATIYAATGYPLLYWHAHLPRPFRWFVEGDFVSLRGLEAWILPAQVLWATLVFAYFSRAIYQGLKQQTIPWGKHLVVTTTILTWYVGIVATNSDFQFTVTNVLVHGLPYMALLWVYTRERARERPGTMLARIASLGFVAFAMTLLVIAFAEELLWDRLVWHDRPTLFGGGWHDAPVLGPWARALIVPLLALPQSTHYVLDAVLWRRKDTGLAQAKALGFPQAPVAAR